MTFFNLSPTPKEFRNQKLNFSVAANLPSQEDLVKIDWAVLEISRLGSLADIATKKNKIKKD